MDYTKDKRSCILQVTLLNNFLAQLFLFLGFWLPCKRVTVTGVFLEKSCLYVLCVTGP